MSRASNQFLKARCTTCHMHLLVWVWARACYTRVNNNSNFFESDMGTSVDRSSTVSQQKQPEAPAPEKEKSEKPLRPCCACPETKKARDECVVEKGEVNCAALIEAHKECLRKLGFKV